MGLKSHLDAMTSTNGIQPAKRARVGVFLIVLGALACAPERPDAAAGPRVAYFEVAGMVQQLGIT